MLSSDKIMAITVGTVVGLVCWLLIWFWSASEREGARYRAICETSGGRPVWNGKFQECLK